MKLEGFALTEQATPAAFIAYAKWYIGRLEKKGNTGFQDPAFEKEMAAAGWLKGDAWCATFVKMVFRKLFTGDLLKAVNRQLNAGARLSANNVKKAGTFETGMVPEPGALVYFLHGNGPSGHAGLVESVDFKTNTMYCIEGNTNASGSREGDRVARKARTIDRPFSAGGLNVYLYVYPRLKN